MRLRMLQLADSAFPVGAFAHSQGFEALRQLGGMRGEAQLLIRLKELIWHTALGALPFLNDAHSGAGAAADSACDAFLSSHVSNRASRAQGRAFAMASSQAFPALPELVLPFAHVAPTCGAIYAALGLSPGEARELFLFGAVRNALSAAVRLGAAGPLRAQALLDSLMPELSAALSETEGLGRLDARSVSPLLDLCQGAQDRLYSRLFQS